MGGAQKPPKMFWALFAEKYKLISTQQREEKDKMSGWQGPNGSLVTKNIGMISNYQVASFSLKSSFYTNETQV